MNTENETFTNDTSTNLTINNTLDFIVTTFITVLLLFIMLTMGCTVDGNKLLTHIKRPCGIMIGFLCQFGVMPLIGYVLAIAFQLKPVSAIAVVLTGCCPGGLGSNMLTFWVDGDMNLSICMTLCSTLLAMGMMPLCLVIYTTKWEDLGNISIPYERLGISLVSLLIPISVGSIINYKWPNKARVLIKIGSVIGVILICIIAVGINWLYKDMWIMDTAFLVTGIIFPWIGFASGLILAWIAREPWERCRTISLETGIQNTGLCSTIIKLAFPNEIAAEMIFFPMVYSCSWIICGITMVAAYKIYKGRSQKNSETHKTMTDNVEENITFTSYATSKNRDED
uniref:ileal sodium/bile acid cotransporter-like n=1 Tax=Pristiophorus japonicus TaxID=55135 RepID=UPI00398F6831